MKDKIIPGDNSSSSSESTDTLTYTGTMKGILRNELDKKCIPLNVKACARFKSMLGGRPLHDKVDLDLRIKIAALNCY